MLKFYMKLLQDQHLIAGIQNIEFFKEHTVKAKSTISSLSIIETIESKENIPPLKAKKKRIVVKKSQMWKIADTSNYQHKFFRY